MRAKPQKHTPQTDLLQGDLEFLVDLNHELCLLADRINWHNFEEDFAGEYGVRHQPYTLKSYLWAPAMDRF